MGQNFRIFVGPVAALAPFTALMPGARVYALKQDAELLALPFDEALQDRLHDRFGTGDWPDGQGVLLSSTDQSFAAECSQHGPLGYLQVDEGEDGVFQSAALWQHGQIMIGPVSLDMKGAGVNRAASLRPVNVVLRALGVVAVPPADEFATFGLGGYETNEDIHARGWPERL